jgi:hypothetical protein
MTLADLVCICIGWISLVGVFALGVFVGCSIRRKESHNDCDHGTGEEGETCRVHDPE